jgi:hypothetical protein
LRRFGAHSSAIDTRWLVALLIADAMRKLAGRVPATRYVIVLT